MTANGWTADGLSRRALAWKEAATGARGTPPVETTMKFSILAFALGSTVLGCGGAVYTFEPTRGAQTPKPVTCEFLVSATVPHDDLYIEIGVLDARRTPSDKIGVFKEEVRAEACQAGADLVVGQIDNFGFYRRGIVFKRVTGGLGVSQAP
jgi:hypothetical protein